ncbi:MAG: DUF3810 domain-containing protein [Clostridia bacterium]|nr:DUF3810 domain-containing protein [Clostridia bacterium]
MDNYLKAYKKLKNRERLPFAVKIIYALTALTVILHIVSALSERFADIFNRYISSGVRFVLTNITDIIPFSLAEMLIICIPIIIFLLVRYAIKYYCDSWRSVIVYIASVFSFICILYILFFWGYGVGYNVPTIDKKLNLERRDVSSIELSETAQILAEKVNEEAENILFRKANFSVMPYNISELSNKLNKCYDSFWTKKGVVSPLSSNLKPVMLSKAMSYTHITGIYSFFTSEANINVDFPDYTIPFTAAHEMAHQRGIAREDEANFIAFLVCIDSDDDYIRYSGYLSMLEYVLNALYRADRDLYTKTIKSLDINIRYEMVAYSSFFEQYRDSVASNISGTINDTYLKLNGTEGERSYGMVVDLAVAYFRNKN